MREKIFKDLLGRKIKEGDNVLHLWTRITHQGWAVYGENGVGYKLATVIGFSEKGVKIEWRDKKHKDTIKKSTIFLSKNRIIALENKRLTINDNDIINDVKKEYEKYKKSRRIQQV